MDVRCEKCGTEYELDEAKLKASGVTVKCTNCGHMFKVRRKGAGGAAAGTGELRTWLVKMEDGEIRACYELTTLQQWISSGSVTPDCTISRTGKKWKRLGDIAELAGFFQTSTSASTVAAHPRTIRRESGARTSRLPQPATGSHGVPSPRKTILGQPGPAIPPPRPRPARPDGKPGQDETRPLSETARRQLAEAARRQAEAARGQGAAKASPWFGGQNTEDEKTVEIERAQVSPPAAGEQTTIDASDDAATTEAPPRSESATASAVGEDTEDLGTQDIEVESASPADEPEPQVGAPEIPRATPVSARREPAAGSASVSGPAGAPRLRPATEDEATAVSESLRPKRRSSSSEIGGERGDGPRTGAWASVGKVGSGLDDDSGPRGPVGGLRLGGHDEDAAFVGGKVRDLSSDDDSAAVPMPSRAGGGAGKWIVIGSLAVLGAAAGVIFFVLSGKGGPVAVASSDPDAGVGPEVAPLSDAGSAAGTASDDQPALEPWQTAVQTANDALGKDDRAELESALAGLATLGDDHVEVVLARGQIMTALAQQDLDAAAVATSSREARALEASARQQARKASEEAKTARRLAGLNGPVLALTADALRLEGKSAREVDRWQRKAAGAASDDRYVRYVGAMALLSAGKKREAHAAFEALVDDSVPDVRPRYRLALMDFAEARYDAARAAAVAVLSLSENHAGARALVDRIADKTRVSDADPMPPEEHGDSHAGGDRNGGGHGGGALGYDQLLAKANHAAESGNCSAATALYKQALDDNPAGVAALTGLGYCHLDRREFAQAQAKFRAALGVSPRYESALYGIAEAYQQQGLKDKAIEAYRAYLAAHPTGTRSASAQRQIDRLGGSTAPATHPAPADQGGGDSGSGDDGAGTDSQAGGSGSGSGVSDSGGAGDDQSESGTGSPGGDSQPTMDAPPSGAGGAGAPDAPAGGDEAGGSATQPDSAGGAATETAPAPATP